MFPFANSEWIGGGLQSLSVFQVEHLKDGEKKGRNLRARVHRELVNAIDDAKTELYKSRYADVVVDAMLAQAKGYQNHKKLNASVDGRPVMVRPLLKKNRIAPPNSATLPTQDFSNGHGSRELGRHQTCWRSTGETGFAYQRTRR